jgi:hypothetical protein
MAVTAFIPGAGDHGLWPLRNVQSCDRDVAPHGRDAGDHGLCPWGSISYLIEKGLICQGDLDKIVSSNGAPKDISIEEPLLTSGVIAGNKIQSCLEEFYGAPIARTEEGLKALREKPSGLRVGAGLIFRRRSLLIPGEVLYLQISG